MLDHIKLLSSPEEQLTYERNAEFTHAPSEMTSIFFEDLYNPDDEQFKSSFTEDERDELSQLSSLLEKAAESQFCSVAELINNDDWKNVMTFAKALINKSG
jgi:hypothetical protein